MSQVASISRSPANGHAPASGIQLAPTARRIPEPARPEPGANPGTGRDDEWFYKVAIAVFGKTETGMQLHLATGWPRTSCYAFVARDPDQRRKPSPEFLRILFRSEHGQPFHDAFMHGCTARWWLDLERERKLAVMAERFRDVLNSV